jgi:hypothetical protein
MEVLVEHAAASKGPTTQRTWADFSAALDVHIFKVSSRELRLLLPYGAPTPAACCSMPYIGLHLEAILRTHDGLHVETEQHD